jgi:CheY-like chemotaxis protein
LIEDILDYARIISGKIRLEIIPLNLVKVLKEAIEAITPAADAKNITLETNFDSNSLVSGDAARLQQVFWNLLSNAIKFTPKGGRIAIKLERINSHVEIGVSDTGDGIRAEFLPFVFERLRQADDSTTRRRGGLGLGLTISRNIIELHGGTIRAASPGEGLGATFTVSLQVRAVGQNEAAANAVGDLSALSSTLVNVPRLDGAVILVVDDHADARNLLSAVLSTQGATVIPTADVAAAVRALESEKFDLIISDIEMPNEDGFALIEKLNAFNAERKKVIPAIALTAQSGSTDRIKILAAGYQIYLQKPIEPAELIAVAANLVRLIK